MEKKKKKKNLPPSFQVWIDIRKKYNLSHAHIQMARELAIEPKSIAKLAGGQQQKWKLPLPQYIESQYFKHFKRERPEVVKSMEQKYKDQKAKKQLKNIEKKNIPPAIKPGQFTLEDIVYPTQEHKAAADAVNDFFSGRQEVSALLLTCSCARNKASSDSCLDIAVLLKPAVFKTSRDSLWDAWKKYYDQHEVFRSLETVGLYSHVDLEIFHGEFEVPPHHWTSGADDFEVAIGNLLVYSVPFFTKDEYLQELKSKWLPYYSEELRKERLEMVLKFCHNNLNHIGPYLERKLYFQAFDRLYHAHKEFLQALFISRRVYPVSYDKWIREQIVEILELPDLYDVIRNIFTIDRFESRVHKNKRDILAHLITEYIDIK